MPIKGSINRLITWLTAIVMGVVLVVVPAVYFLVSSQYLSGGVEAEAEINARIITQIIGENPRMWEFEQARIREYLSRRPRKGHAEARRVLNAQDELVAEVADRVPAPVIKRSVPLYDAGAAVGRLEISRSLRPLLARTAVIFLCMLPFAAAVFLALFLLPIRAVRRSEAALRSERDAAQKYLDVAGVMLVVIGADRCVRLINKKGCDILGYSEQELLGKDWFDQALPKKSTAAQARFLDVLAGTTRDLVSVEGPVLTRGGGERAIAWHLISLADSGGGMLLSGEDITERKKLEAQLRHSQKMEAVGQLAGGVAHDFNNILTAIIGYASLLTMKTERDDPLRHNIDQILASAERAAHLTEGLLTYSRKQIYTPRPVDVNDAVRNVEKLLRRIIGEDIELRTVFGGGAMRILADPGQLDQVLMNLAANARDAMPQGGVLAIETSSTFQDEEFIRHHGFGAPGTYALITVSDTGHGMDRRTAEKIFDPFFTTKDVGKGTGLGLAIVYGIVKQHEGYIVVYSEEGTGTSFKLYFPLVHDPVRGHDAGETAPPARGVETILLAEDDGAVRSLTKAVLQDFGYRVLEAKDGEEAIRVFEEHKEAIRMVVLDVIMPKKNGRQAYEEIKKIRPEVKALFTSGYTADVIDTKGMMDPALPLLPKPAPPVRLLAKVREVLDS